jgi:chaperonin GroES
MSKTILHPLSDRVVIKRIDVDEMTAGGLYIPEQAKEKPRRGTVLAVGDVSALKVGDTVLFGKYAGVELEVDGEKLLVMKEEDVVAKVETVE